jgi:hypothetical protein
MCPEEHPFEEAKRILKDAPDAIDFLVKHATDARWECVQRAHSIFKEHFEKSKTETMTKHDKHKQ